MSEEITKDFEKIVPKRWKRYPRYKDSGVEWIGEIPEEWKVTKLKWLSTEPLKYGLNEPASESNQNDPRYVRITDITDEGILRDDTFKSIPQDIAKGYLLEEGDLLFARSGATVGKTFIYNHSWGVCCFAGYLIGFRANASKVSARYLYYFTKSSAYWNWLNSSFTKSTIQNASADKYKSLPVSVPNIESQREILNFLDGSCKRIDSLISKKQLLIELLKEKRAAIILRAVTKGLDPNAPMKDSGVEWVGKMPQEWDLVRFKHTAKMKYGSSLPSELRNDGDFLVYGSNGPVGMNSCANTSAPVVVLGRKGSFGKVNYSDKPVFAIDTTYYIDKNCTDSHMKWLFYLLQVLDLDSVSMDTGVPGLSREHVHELIIPNCGYAEQRRISVFLDNVTSKIDFFISKIEKSIELLKEYRSALITAAVTGKIDVREEVP